MGYNARATLFFGVPIDRDSEVHAAIQAADEADGPPAAGTLAYLALHGVGEDEGCVILEHGYMYAAQWAVAGEESVQEVEAGDPLRVNAAAPYWWTVAVERFCAKWGLPQPLPGWHIAASYR
jgi:hypothetical protein